MPYKHIGQRVEVRVSARMVEIFFNRLRLEVDMVIGASGRADTGEQQAQVVVDLRDRADGRARVVRRGFLLDGNGG